MVADAKLLGVISYYRSAELHGAALLMRLIRLMDADPDAQIKLTRHVAEETQHAWLWTKRITDMGCAPLKVPDGYQSRIGMRTMPRTLVELLALTIVVEARALSRYREHAARPDVDDATRAVLHTVSADEQWHIAWMREKLNELVAGDGGAPERVNTIMERYRRIEAEVYAELVALETEGQPSHRPG
jgi:bacterioferritin (cytochrome b1)